MVTLGVGVTKTVGCSGLAAIGVVPAAPGGERRIGLIYDTFTPRDALRTPVVLREARASRRWIVDEPASERVDADIHPARTIADLRRMLRGR